MPSSPQNLANSAKLMSKGVLVSTTWPPPERLSLFARLNCANDSGALTQNRCNTETTTIITVIGTGRIFAFCFPVLEDAGAWLLSDDGLPSAHEMFTLAAWIADSGFLPGEALTNWASTYLRSKRVLRIVFSGDPIQKTARQQPEWITDLEVPDQAVSGTLSRK